MRTQTFRSRPFWYGLRERIDIETHQRFHAMMRVKLFDLQQEIVYDKHRFKTMSIGRRWGKTLMEAADCCTVAGLGGHVWAVAPQYELSDVIFDQCLELCADQTLPISQLVYDWNTSKGSKRIRFTTQGQIVTKSSERPRALVGRGLDKIVFDEAAKEENSAVLTSYLMPCLSDRRGSLDLISTPEGKNWYYYEWLKGDPKNLLSRDPDYMSWTMGSVTSKRLPAHLVLAECMGMKARLPSLVYSQEYDAEFLDDGGTVFRNVRKQAKSKLLESPLRGHRYVIGVDIARSIDYTVIMAMDSATKEVVAMERFQHIDWPTQRQKVLQMARKWLAPVLVDSTGGGDVFLGELLAMDFPVGVEGYKFNMESKSRLINTLALGFEHESIWIPEEPTIINELEIYRATRTLDTAHYKYSAPINCHDDCVIGLALAYEMALRHGTNNWSDGLVGDRGVSDEAKRNEDEGDRWT